VTVDGENFSLINQELLIPVSFDIPQKLKYVRKTMLDIFNEYNIIKAGIRVTEPIGDANDFRIMLEGIIQELIASSKVEQYFTGVKASIGSKLGIPNDGSITEIMEGKLPFENIPDWSSISKEHRECIMIAFATKNLNQIYA
jgi:hypothetical protein